MAFKSFPVAIGSTDTDVFECPAATEAAVVLLVSNVSSSARTYTVKHYKASLDATLTVISTKSLAANTFEKVAAPISMEAGDKLIMLCSNANDIVVGGTITLSGTVQVISTFVSEGEWDSETTYTENVSIVSRSGNSYLARPNAEPNVGQDPATATDFWTLLAEKGATGDGDLSAANNLSDLADVSQARENLGLQIGADVQAYDAATLKGDVEGQSITGGAGITPKDLGNTTGGGTKTIDVRDRAMQIIENTEAFTLDVAAQSGQCVLLIKNGSGAGSITTSGFTHVRGDAFTTTNGHVFRCTIEYWDSSNHYLWVEAMQ
jgi:hypothetical protein